MFFLLVETRTITKGGPLKPSSDKAPNKPATKRPAEPASGKKPPESPAKPGAAKGKSFITFCKFSNLGLS